MMRLQEKIWASFTPDVGRKAYSKRLSDGASCLGNKCACYISSTIFKNEGNAAATWKQENSQRFLEKSGHF